MNNFIEDFLPHLTTVCVVSSPEIYDDESSRNVLWKMLKLVFPQKSDKDFFTMKKCILWRRFLTLKTTTSYYDLTLNTRRKMARQETKVRCVPTLSKLKINHLFRGLDLHKGAWAGRDTKKPVCLDLEASAIFN